MSTLGRGLGAGIEQSIARAPVTIIEGGRAVGKSTLCRALARERGWPAPLDLSEPGLLAQIRVDPLRFLRDLKATAIIDEAQLEPALPLWIKRIVDDRGGRPGQFVLTGSARLGRSQLGGSDPLAGRSERYRMWPMTEGEMHANLRSLAARLFARLPFKPGAVVPGSKAPPDRTDAWLRGGLPGIAGVLGRASGSAWERAMTSYVESVIPLGARSERVDHARLLHAFRYLAANPAQLFNATRMASELGCKADTVSSYLEQLEACFLLFRAEAHRPNEHKVLTAHPRIYCCDVGLAAWAMRVCEPGRPPNPLQRGALLENRVALAIIATVDWCEERIVVRHWRDQRAKREVDLLLAHPDGRTVGIEVKASQSVGPDDTQGLIAFALANPESFAAGFLVYTGERVVDLTPRGLRARSILAVPAELFLNLV